MDLNAVLSARPSAGPATAAEVADRVRATGRVLVVLDDDPTGTQAVAGLPVLTRWTVADLSWALSTGAPAVYVVTNTRSLDAADAAHINREVVHAALAAAAAQGVALGWVSRGDSTLRGHFPLETDAISDALAEAGLARPDGVVVIPAFPEAGRVTVDGIHYTRDDNTWTPVGESEFARDATFGFSSSHLADWVAEKSHGDIAAGDVVCIGLDTLRAGATAVAAALTAAEPGSVCVADAVVEDDLRQLALGLDLAEATGRSYIYRVGPPFVRARIGGDPAPALTPAPGARASVPGGMIVVGSHTAVTTRQLTALRTVTPEAAVIELDVVALRAHADPAALLDRIADRCVSSLGLTDVILQTSRSLVRVADPVESLAISRSVSDALVAIMQRVLAAETPAFVIAKGGITSSDIASKGLQISRANVEGSLFPGMVSVWRPVSGPAEGMPFVVFPGNVGAASSLADAVLRMRASRAEAPDAHTHPTRQPTNSTPGGEA